MELNVCHSPFYLTWYYGPGAVRRLAGQLLATGYDSLGALAPVKRGLVYGDRELGARIRRRAKALLSSG